MKKIMFVCHGNICRSPMAQFIFQKLLEENGLCDKYEVSSCATSTEEIYMGVGNPVYPPAKKILSQHGISCEGKTAVRLKKCDGDKFDMFICMDSNNVRNALAILGNDKKAKVFKLLDFTGENRDVSDPWYTRRFDIAYDDILSGCKALLDTLENK